MQLSSKQDFQALMHLFLDPLKPCYSAGRARLHLGETGVTYGQAAIELGGVQPALCGRWCPSGRGAVRTPPLRRSTAVAMAAGADPQNPEYWGECGDYDQCFVEMAAIACGLLTVPQKAVGPPSRTPKAEPWPAGWTRSTTTRSPRATGSSL